MRIESPDVTKLTYLSPVNGVPEINKNYSEKNNGQMNGGFSNLTQNISTTQNMNCYTPMIPLTHMEKEGPDL